MRRSHRIVGELLVVLPFLSTVPAAPARGQAPSAAARPDAFAYVRALDQAGAKELWPGFDPSSLPLAIFDGEQTFLLRHPGPPPEFSPAKGRPGVLVSPGRHPAVVANSTREIGGVRTATVIATGAQGVESTLLATVEEVFHVFWLARHPSFRPDEMARYAYPVDDAENLRPLLAEDEALARALEADGDPEAAGWAAGALRIRGDRLPRLAEETRTWETSLETMEGTANYVARRALDQGPAETARRLRGARPAEGIRWRFYETGTALCFVLDRLDPGWKARSEKQPDRPLVELLGDALARRDVKPNAFAAAEVEGFRTRAAGDVEALALRRRQLRRELLERTGPRVVVEVADGAAPFRLLRFDPVNLFVLDGGEVAHVNFLVLTGPGGTVEVANAAFSRGSFAGTVGLTTPAGRHPLRDGIRRLTIVGIRDRPRLFRSEDAIKLEAPGLRIDLPNAVARTAGDTTRIEVRGDGAVAAP